ncbi:ribonuclease P protein component [Limisalsivibrio acetivorans]|uniref:ribonuclease P protein component n=1 Tax=Limisalsivibrio acetivorans TaxID=1304888 RepID=UPI0003B44A1F|nr:ribonuclease P protein component [Limisalsivibrio acetivorans]
MDRRLRKSERLRNNTDYQRVIRRKRIFGRCLAIYYAPSAEEQNRYGFIAGKKVSPRAVVRNRIKRYFKEICRNSKDLTPAGFDLVFRALPPAGKASYKEIEDEALGLLEKIRSGCTAGGADKAIPESSLTDSR